METEKKKQLTVSFDFGVQISVDAGTTLLELSREYSSFYKSTIIAARVNNSIKESVLTHKFFLCYSEPPFMGNP